MQTLKTLVVLAVLAIVGYGLYVGLNNGFEFANVPPQTPDWIEREINDPAGGAPAPPAIELGSTPDATPNSPPVFTPGAPPDPNLADQTATPDAPVARYPGMLANPPPAAATAGQPQANIEYAPPSAAAVGNPYTPPATNLATPLAPPLSPPSAPVDPTFTTAQAPDSVPNQNIPPLSSTPRPPFPAATDPLSTNQTYQPPAAAQVQDKAFTEAIAAARVQLNNRQFSTALLSLSLWYQDQSLAPQDHNDLVTLLDQVAGSAIYSREHLLEPAHVATAGEKLEDIAARYNVPAELLAKINGLSTTEPLAAGLELKVVRGPFYGVIDTHRNLLTLWVAQRYAGRFMVSVGPEFQQIVGTFVVNNKSRSHAANNGLAYIQLGAGYPGASPPTPNAHQLSIVGMQNPADAARGEVPGRVGVSIKDAGDLIDILSEGSQITIRR